MDKNYLIQLTNNLYRLTLFFPKKEPLRYKMRELADEILANSLRIIYPVRNQKFSNGANQYESTNPSKKTEAGPLLADLEALDSFFEVAKNQNWVSPAQILEIQKEYSKIREGLKQLSEIVTPKVEKVAKIEVEPLEKIGRNPISERQKKILEILKEKEKAQVWEIKKIFPEVTKRTLRRDFEFLLKRGIIERIGERNDTFYQLRIGQELGRT